MLDSSSSSVAEAVVASTCRDDTAVEQQGEFSNVVPHSAGQQIRITVI